MSLHTTTTGVCSSHHAVVASYSELHEEGEVNAHNYSRCVLLTPAVVASYSELYEEGEVISPHIGPPSYSNMCIYTSHMCTIYVYMYSILHYTYMYMYIQQGGTCTMYMQQGAVKEYPSSSSVYTQLGIKIRLLCTHLTPTPTHTYVYIHM